MQLNTRRVLSSFMATFLCLTITPAIAQTAPSNSGTNSPIALDLTSTTASLTAGKLLGNGTADITVGHTHQSVNGNTLLTPAERLAVYQVISTGHQSILLGAQGNAVGGTFSIGPQFSNYVSSLVIPQGVTAVKDFGLSSSLSLTGNLTNAGHLYALSTNSGITNGTIAAANITNQTTGLISSVLPVGLASGYSSLVPNLSLTLNAVNNLVNAGIIHSAGSLTATAGGSITNALPSGVIGSLPVMQALTNVNLQMSTLINAGLIASQSSNINIAGLTSSNLSIQNLGGSMNALNGIINVRDSSFSGKYATDIVGGVLNSKDLNIFASGGTVNVMVDSISGTLNMTADTAHTSVNSGILTLGNLTMSGDPDFYNTAGSVNLTGTINTGGASLAVVASGDITTSAPLAIKTLGGNVTFVAGAQFTSSGAPSSSGTNDTLTLTGFNSTGNILLTKLGFLDARVGVGVNGNGGSVIMTAPGAILLGPSSVVSTSGAGAGFAAGDITMTAGASSGTAISALGQFFPCPRSGTSGAVSGKMTVQNYMPTVNGASVVITNGAITSGSFGINNNTGGGSVSLGSIIGANPTGNSAAILIAAPRSAVITNAITNNSTNGNAGTVAIYGSSVATNFINVGQSGSAGSAGIVSIISSGPITTGTITASSSANGGTGGTVALIGSGSVTTNAIYADATQGSGGTITVDGGIGNVTTAALTTNGVTGGGDVAVAGGNVSVGSIDTFGTNSGAVTITASGNIATGGSINAAASNQASDVSLNAGGSVRVAGDISVDGDVKAGNVTINGQGNVSAYKVYAFSAGSDAASIAGNVNINAGPNSTVSLEAVSVYSPGTAGNISLTGYDVQVYGKSDFNVISLDAMGTYKAGNIFVQATDPNTDFTVGAVTRNGTAYSIVANGPSGSVHLSECGTLVILPNFAISAIGGQVTLDRACCGNSASRSVSASQFLGTADGIASYSLASPEILQTDTARGGLPVANLPPLAPGDVPMIPIGGNAFIPGVMLANGLIGQDGSGLIGQDGSGLIGQDGSGLIGQDGSGLIGQDGSGLVVKAGDAIVATGAGNIVSAGAGNIVSAGAGNAIPGWSNSGASFVCLSCGVGALAPHGLHTSTSAQVIPLEKGAALFSATKAITVVGQKAKVRLDKGAVGLFLQTGSGLAVYNLHDRREGSVVVDTGDSVIPIAPGQMVTLSSLAGTFEQVCPGRGIAYRNARSIKASRYNAYVCDFSLVSAVANVPPLAYMVKSKDHAHKKTASDILKDAAILMQMRGSNYPYKML